MEVWPDILSNVEHNVREVILQIGKMLMGLRTWDSQLLRLKEMEILLSQSPKELEEW